MLARSTVNWSQSTFDFICRWILPAGYIALLAGMMLVAERPQYHRLVYLLLCFPALLALCLKPSGVRVLLREPMVLAFLAFAGWAILSIAWSPAGDDVDGLVKRPIYVIMLFAASAMLALLQPKRLRYAYLTAAVLVLLASVYSLILFFEHYKAGNRMIGGFGALDNPLLSSHLFGFFCTYWLAIGMSQRRRRAILLATPALLVMITATLATGSRTPLLALLLASVWLIALRGGRRGLLLFIGLLAGGALLLLFPDTLLSRGTSYRLELWHLSLQEIAKAPWLGHGYRATLAIDPGNGIEFSEPHSFILGVLYYVGIIGLLPWLCMYLLGLYSAWRNRRDPMYMIASALLVFGLGAGLTEGGDILSRPKEHWLLLWIPLTLLAGLNIATRLRFGRTVEMRDLPVSDYERLSARSRLIEEDGLGPKVLELADGSFLKLFRRKRLVSSARLLPYAKRFANNCRFLLRLGIPAPEVTGLYQLDERTTAVQYTPLPGQTLRQALAAASSDKARARLVRRFGALLGQLHELGVYFRSLHLGNVLVLPDGDFALIDVADMNIRLSPLGRTLRIRNLRHMQRYPEDRRVLFEQHLPQLLEGYALEAGKRAAEDIRQNVENRTPA
ncbi:O-antigen ligase family protein [Pseudomonas sp. SCB32]|uniref:O-antigen ligase family protein n=1 Tax=Pseudomonas sp. SCB32 TaxID=2653853 RepID=UPI0012658EF5|nr:O-antigen ligase family protein [Pseudomonas sp. SCB32]